MQSRPVDSPKPVARVSVPSPAQQAASAKKALARQLLLVSILLDSYGFPERLKLSKASSRRVCQYTSPVCGESLAVQVNTTTQKALMGTIVWQEATQRAVGQFDAAVLEIDAEEAEQLAAVEAAMRRLRVSLPPSGALQKH